MPHTRLPRLARLVAAQAAALALLAGCAADAPVQVRAAPAYCPAPPAIAVNAQGLVLPAEALRGGGGGDWETVFAYQLEHGLASPRTLAGRGPETAQQLARLEMLGNSFDRNLRFQRLPAFGLFSMREGRLALRDTLGVGPGIADAELAGALLATECALWAGDRVGARAALARVAQAPDALDLIDPPGGNSPPRIPVAVARAASSAAKAMRAMDFPDSPLLRFGARSF